MDYDELMAFAALAPRRSAPDPIKLTWWQWEWLRVLVPAGVAGPSSVWGAPIELVDDVEQSTPVLEGWRWRGSEAGRLRSGMMAMRDFEERTKRLVDLSAAEAAEAVERFTAAIKETENE